MDELTRVDVPTSGGVVGRTTATVRADILAEMKRLGLARFEHNGRSRRGAAKTKTLRGLFAEMADIISENYSDSHLVLGGVIANAATETLVAYGTALLVATVDLTGDESPSLIVQLAMTSLRLND